MFAKKKQPPIKSLIAQGSRIDGNITFAEGLRVDGDVVGDIRVDESQPSLLVISETATVMGAVYADHLIINGRIKGPVHARELLELQPHARIEGDVYYKALETRKTASVKQKSRNKQNLLRLFAEKKAD